MQLIAWKKTIIWSEEFFSKYLDHNFHLFIFSIYNFNFNYSFSIYIF